jgi:hypothetical protein
LKKVEVVAPLNTSEDDLKIQEGHEKLKVKKRNQQEK